MPFSYHTSQWLPYSVPQVFAFFAQPRNLPRLMPAWQKAQIDWPTSHLTPPHLPSEEPSVDLTNAAGEGSRIVLRFQPLPFVPFRLSWESEIVSFSWNDRFCDRQLSGPFTSWKHCHCVRSMQHNGIAGSWIVDDIEYEVPFGIAGKLAHRLWLRRQIEQAFVYRTVSLKRSSRPSRSKHLLRTPIAPLPQSHPPALHRSQIRPRLLQRRLSRQPILLAQSLPPCHAR